MSGFNLSLVERNTPPLFGLGQVDAIPSEVLVAAAEKQPRDVQGRVGRTREGRIGRFGWKAQIPSLHEFVRVACANELGLEVPGHPQATSPLSPGSKAKGLDLTEADCDALVSYVRTLPAPVVVDPDGPQGNEDLREGRRLFDEVGCATCHAPTLGEVKGIYSDLLLHDMGQSLSDSGSSYGIDGPDTPMGPKPREWRTPPLWGYRDSGPYLHDGRAQGLEEAVALHDGQARSSAHRFFSLSWRERAQVEAFLKSLVAPSAAAAPGIMLAADLESRLQREPTARPRARSRQRRRPSLATSSNGTRPGVGSGPRRPPSGPGPSSPWPSRWRRWARPPAPSISIARSPATPPAPTRAAWPPSGSTCSARGSSRPELRACAGPGGSSGISDGSGRRSSSRASGLPNSTAARASYRRRSIPAGLMDQ